MTSTTRRSWAIAAAAPVSILANAADAQRLVDFASALRRVGGQLSLLPAAGRMAPHIVISGNGHVLPPMEGVMVCGSSYEFEDTPALTTHEANTTNLARLASLLPDESGVEATHDITGERATRAVARDRLPLIGAIADIAAARRDGAGISQLHDMPRLDGLYCATAFGSRGIIWSALAAEMLANQLEGEPLCVETELAQAVDPSRFALRSLRHGLL